MTKQTEPKDAREMTADEYRAHKAELLRGDYTPTTPSDPGAKPVREMTKAEYAAHKANVLRTSR